MSFWVCRSGKLKVKYFLNLLMNYSYIYICMYILSGHICTTQWLTLYILIRDKFNNNINVRLKILIFNKVHLKLNEMKKIKKKKKILLIYFVFAFLGELNYQFRMNATEVGQIIKFTLTFYPFMLVTYFGRKITFGIKHFTRNTV